MGRPEAPIPPDVPQALREFAEGLRALRHEAGLGYRAMGKAAGVSSTALSQAASGNRLPTEAIVAAYASACGQNTDEWIRKRNAVERRLRSDRRQDAAQADDSVGVTVTAGDAKKTFPLRTRSEWERSLRSAGDAATTPKLRVWCRNLAVVLRELGFERTGQSPLSRRSYLAGVRMPNEEDLVTQLAKLGLSVSTREELRRGLRLATVERVDQFVSASAVPRAMDGSVPVGSTPVRALEAGPAGVRRPELDLVALPGEFIRELRRAISASGKSFRQLSKEARIPVSTIYDLVRPATKPSEDVRLPSLDWVAKLLRACGVSPLEMIFFEQALRRVQKVELELKTRSHTSEPNSEPMPVLVPTGEEDPLARQRVMTMLAGGALLIVLVVTTIWVLVK